jgi:hypothetical protein
MARLVLVKIGVDVIQSDEPAFNVYVYAEKVREWGPERRCPLVGSLFSARSALSRGNMASEALDRQ